MSYFKDMLAIGFYTVAELEVKLAHYQIEHPTHSITKEIEEALNENYECIQSGDVQVSGSHQHQ